MLHSTDLKVIVIGDSGTGKTSFIWKWTKDTFDNKYKETIVADLAFKRFDIDEGRYNIQLWDITGQDKNQSLTKILAKDSHGYIVMSDATNVETRKK